MLLLGILALRLLRPHTRGVSEGRRLGSGLTMLSTLRTYSVGILLPPLMMLSALQAVVPLRAGLAHRLLLPEKPARLDRALRGWALRRHLLCALNLRFLGHRIALRRLLLGLRLDSVWVLRLRLRRLLLGVHAERCSPCVLLRWKHKGSYRREGPGA